MPLIDVCSPVIQCADVVRDLGVLLDSELSMQSHITSARFYHLRRLRQIQNYVSQEVVTQLVRSHVIYCLDYCNSVLAGLSACTVHVHWRLCNVCNMLLLDLR